MTQNRDYYYQFLDWLSIAHTLETVNSYKWGLKIFIDWLDGVEKDLLSLQEKDFVEYAHYLKDDRRVKNSTAASYFSGVRTIWRWLYRQNLVANSNEMIPIPKADDGEHYPFLTEEELKVVLNSFDEFYPLELRDKTAFAFLFATGLRIGEFLQMNVGDIDLIKQKATVKTEKRKNHHREVYWDDETNELLRKWIEVRGKILSHRSSKKTDALWVNLSPQGFGQRAQKCIFQKLFRRKREELGITKKITPHACRHGFGHKAVKMEVHPRMLQKMLGHAKLNTTMIYMGVEDIEVEKVYREKMMVMA